MVDGKSGGIVSGGRAEELLMTETVAAKQATTPADVAAPHDNPHHARRWWILTVLAIAQLTVVLDSTVVNIALPTAQRALGFNDNDRQWIVTGYALAFGSLLLIGGRLADLLGRKRVFIIGLAGFAVASAVGGASNGFAMLVTARAVQGGFAALLAPAALALLTTTFVEAKERAKAFGIYGAIAGAGAAVGLLLGGILTEYASWRWTMYVNLIFAVAAIIGGGLLLVHTPAVERPKLDWPGTVTVSAGLFSVVYGFSHAETAGWGSGVTVGFLVAAVVLLAAFVAIQTRAVQPLLPLRVIVDRNRGGAFLAMFASAAGMFGVFLFLTYYLQGSQHYSAVQTGVAFLPMVGVLIAASTVVSVTLAGRLSPRVMIPLGMLVSAAGMWILTGLSLHASYVSHTLPGTMIIGVGLGTVFATAMSMATLGVHAEDAGVASALVNTMQQVGGSVGTALLNTLAATAATTFVAAHIADPAAVQLAAVHSYVVAFWWSAAIFAVGAALVAALLRSGVPDVNANADDVVIA
jgi:EmrB/QacA subfamily drug resistance transporter